MATSPYRSWRVVAAGRTCAHHGTSSGFRLHSRQASVTSIAMSVCRTLCTLKPNDSYTSVTQILTREP
eukprot:2827109-Rhodomonas_salina.2